MQRDLSSRVSRTQPLLIALLTLGLVLWAAGPAAAQPTLGACNVGNGFGSTLLYPYFEVDSADPGGLSTLLSINNGFNNATLVRAVLWTDWGVPTLAFDIYLDGFDLITINMRDLFNGVVPSTGEGVDLSPFDGCDGSPPFHSNPVLTAMQREQLADDHQGVEGPIFPTCVGQAYGDGVSRGYLTVDVVDQCSGVEANAAGVTPASASYFVDGGEAGGVAIINNRLWGDVIYVDPNNASAQGSEAVAVWADSEQFAGTDIFTFYGRYSNWDGRDDRVPLPDIWNSRFLNGGPFAGGASVIVYRDTAANTGGGITDCSPDSIPSWAPLSDNTIARDEDGGSFFTVGEGENFGIATQRTSTSSFGIPYNFGRLQIQTGSLGSWVQGTLSASGLFSAAFNATAVTTTCDNSPPSTITTGTADEKAVARPAQNASLWDLRMAGGKK